MSQSRIRRGSRAMSANVGTSTATASAIDFRDMAGGIVAFTPAMPSAATAVALYASDAMQGPFHEMRDRDGVALSIKLSTNTAAAYALPFEVADALWLCLVSDNAGSTASVALVSMKG